MQKWKDCLVGYFLDRKLPFMVVRNIAMKIWVKFGLTEVLSSDKGFFFFRFDNSEAFTQISKAGPWHFGGRHDRKTMEIPDEVGEGAVG